MLPDGSGLVRVTSTDALDFAGDTIRGGPGDDGCRDDGADNQASC
jgi:hypothetical protein